MSVYFFWRKPMNNKVLDMEKTEVDPETGPGVKGRRRMALLLQVSERQLDRLTAEGVLPQRPDGLYAITETIDRHAEYLAGKLHKPSRSDRVHAAQAELIQRRLDREREASIPMPDALAVFDQVTEEFLASITEVGRETGRGQPEPERKRISAIVDQVSAKLAAHFAVERTALVTGKREADE
ncbi:hypothetical protein N8D56_19750 [Devosia sp. A8/3-2]|nr:hypothetical protein N8D56_19750 [Devosia sp. A8/3-2]